MQIEDNQEQSTTDDTTPTVLGGINDDDWPQYVNDWRGLFLEAISNGERPASAAALAGVSKSAPYLAAARNKDFARHWADAAEPSNNYRVDSLEDTVYDDATDGSYSHAKLWLSGNCDRYRPAPAAQVNVLNLSPDYGPVAALTAQELETLQAFAHAQLVAAPVLTVDIDVDTDTESTDTAAKSQGEGEG